MSGNSNNRNPLNKSKHIAFVVGTFPVLSETFIVNQIVDQIDRGNKVTILAFERNNNIVPHDIIEEYKLLDRCVFFENMPKNPLSRLSKAIRILSSSRNKKWTVIFNCLNAFKHRSYAFRLTQLFRAQWFLERRDFDLIHVHFGTNAIPIANLIHEGIIPRIPMLVTFHGFDLSPNRLNEFSEKYRNVFRYSKGFTVNTLYTRELLEQIYLGSNVEVLPVGLDTLKFKMTDLRDKNNRDTTLLFCGRLIKWKAPDKAIDIFNELKKNNNYSKLKLVIIGDGPLMALLKSRVDQFKLKDNVDFKGALSQDEIINEMIRADIFLYPGIEDPETKRAENQGLVIQEAQSMQLPVVISDAGGMKEGIIPNESGYMVQQDNFDQYLVVLKKLIDDPELRLEMGQKGRKFVVQNYDSKFLGDKLNSIYEGYLK